MFIQVGTLLTEVKSRKAGEVIGFGNERSFTRGMLKMLNCIRLRAGPKVMKWKQQMGLLYFEKFAAKIWG